MNQIYSLKGCRFSFILFVFCLGICSSSFAQTYNFRNYSVEDGLPFIDVNTIFQDSKGNLWSGGYGGLSKFDGNHFENYGTKQGLSNYFVSSIAEDSSGNLWIGTINGVSRFNGKEFVNYYAKDGLAGNHVNSILVDTKGMIWFGTNTGACRFNGKKFIKITGRDGLKGELIYKIFEDRNHEIWFGTEQGVSRCFGKINQNYTKKEGLCDNIVNTITEDHSGRYWFGTKNGVSCFDGKKFMNFSVDNGLTGNSIKTILCDHHNNVWIGSSKGLCKYDGTGIKKYPILKDQGSTIIESLFEDFEGNLWVGTYSGMFRYRNDAFLTYTIRDGLGSNFIFQVFEDKSGLLWIGTNDDGINIFNGKTFSNLSVKNGLSGNKVLSAIEDKNGIIWFGTENGIDRYDRKKCVNYKVKKNLKNKSVNVLMQDSKGNIWFGEGNTAFRFDPAKINPNSLNDTSFSFSKNDEGDVTSICEDRNGNIWFGEYQGGLYKYDGKSISDEGKKLGLRSNSYMAITVDQQGNLYFGTFDGVQMYDGKKVTSFSEQDGLSSDLVYTMILINHDEELWIGTNQGLNKLKIREFKRSGKKILEHISQEEGFNGVESNTNGVCVDKEGAVWFGTVGGLVKYDPSVDEPNLVESRTSITNIKIFDKDTVLQNHSVLDYDLNHVSFVYSGISLTNPYKVKYQYLLEGFDKSWSPPAKENFSNYSNLPHGKYTFKVRSCNSEGVWNAHPEEFTFTILAPFWKTWWFRLTVTCLFIASLVIYYRYRIREIEIRERTKLRVTTNELKALRSQMNPHFLFNSLNSIQNFIMTNDATAASKYLNKFARLMRVILNNSEKPVVTIHEEMDALKLYLELETLRFENKFDYRIDIDPDLDTDFYSMPTMLIQPYVENAILHGLFPKKSHGMLKLHIGLGKTHIKCTIEDNGIGRKRSLEMKESSIKKVHESMGMKITKDRLELLNTLHHSKVNVIVTDLEGDDHESLGTKVEIFIPIE